MIKCVHKTERFLHSRRGLAAWVDQQDIRALCSSATEQPDTQQATVRRCEGPAQHMTIVAVWVGGWVRGQANVPQVEPDVKRAS